MHSVGSVAGCIGREEVLPQHEIGARIIAGGNLVEPQHPVVALVRQEQRARRIDERTAVRVINRVGFRRRRVALVRAVAGEILLADNHARSLKRL